MANIMSQEVVDKLDELRARLFCVIEDEGNQGFFQDEGDGSSCLDQLTGIHDEVVGLLEGNKPKGCCGDNDTKEMRNPFFSGKKSILICTNTGCTFGPEEGVKHSPDCPDAE